MSKRYLIGLAAFLPWLFAMSSHSNTLRVPSEYSTINMALDASMEGDTVLVAPGTYAEAEERWVLLNNLLLVTSIGFLKSGVTLKSEAGPEATTLDLQGQESSWGYGHVLVASNLTSPTRVEGFSLTGAPPDNQGVIVLNSTSVRFDSCIFHDFNDRAVICGPGNTEFYGCAFRDCTVTGQAGGAGITHGDGNLMVDGCAFERCFGGIDASNGEPMFDSVTIRDSIFRQNTNLSIGAGDVNELLIEGCIFADNFAFEQPASVYSVRSKITLRRNLFVRQYTAGFESGGATRIGGFSLGPLIVENNTFYECRKDPAFDTEASALRVTAAGPFPLIFVRNNVFGKCTGGPAAYLAPPPATIETSCNVFWENPDGNMNLPFDPSDRIIDPEFCDPAQDDFTVNATSPCLPKYALGCGLIGAFGEGCGSVSVEEMSWGRIKNFYRLSE